MAFLLVALITGLGALSLSVRLGVESRRRRRYFQFAHRFGLDFAPVDPIGLIDHTFDLFNRADGATVRNVVCGTWHGVPVRAGELRFAPGAEARRSGVHGSLHRFSFAFAEIPAWVPHVSIRRRSDAHVADFFELNRIRLESDTFNRTYEVECEDREFAYRFVDARMMQCLMDLAVAHRFEFEIRGPRLLVSCALLPPEELVPLLGAAKALHEAVPRMVLREYATSATGA